MENAQWLPNTLFAEYCNQERPILDRIPIDNRFKRTLAQTMELFHQKYVNHI